MITKLSNRKINFFETNGYAFMMDFWSIDEFEHCRKAFAQVVKEGRWK